MNKTMLKIIASSVIGISLLTGCTAGGSGVVPGDGNVSYGDAKAVETLTADFG